MARMRSAERVAFQVEAERLAMERMACEALGGLTDTVEARSMICDGLGVAALTKAGVNTRKGLEKVYKRAERLAEKRAEETFDMIIQQEPQQYADAIAIQ